MRTRLMVLAVLAAALGAAGKDRPTGLPGSTAPDDLVQSVRAAQSPTYKLCVNGAACTANLPPACASPSSPCGVCNGLANQTCTGAAAAAPCTQSTVSCCFLQKECLSTTAGCTCTKVAPVAAGARSKC